MSGLLDVNVLIALAWPPHEHHAQALAWFRQHGQAGWGSTAMTQAAFVRIVSQPSFAGQPMSVGEAGKALLQMTSHAAHRLLPMDFGFDQVLRVCTGGLHGHRQITDAYLLTAASRHGMRLVSFDTGLTQLLASDAERRRLIHLLD